MMSVRRREDWALKMPPADWLVVCQRECGWDRPKAACGRLVSLRLALKAAAESGLGWAHELKLGPIALPFGGAAGPGPGPCCCSSLCTSLLGAGARADSRQASYCGAPEEGGAWGPSHETRLGGGGCGVGADPLEAMREADSAGMVRYDPAARPRTLGEDSR